VFAIVSFFSWQNQNLTFFFVFFENWKTTNKQGNFEFSWTIIAWSYAWEIAGPVFDNCRLEYWLLQMCWRILLCLQINYLWVIYTGEKTTLLFFLVFLIFWNEKQKKKTVLTNLRYLNFVNWQQSPNYLWIDNKALIICELITKSKLFVNCSKAWIIWIAAEPFVNCVNYWNEMIANLTRFLP